MCPETFIDEVEQLSKIYRSESYPDFYIRTAYSIDDEQLMNLGQEQIDCSQFTLGFFRTPSYLAVSALQYNRSETKVIVLAKRPDVVVGMLNIGWKYCYLNAQADLIRYISDLKVLPVYRGRKLIHFMMQFLRETLPLGTVVQSIVPNQHAELQRILYTPRQGFATAQLYDHVHIYNLCHIKMPEQYTRFRFEVLTESSVSAATNFIAEMKAYYNFLPTYDFAALAVGGHPFWCGLKLSDFYLVYNRANKIIGIYGLWDQMAFKQAKIVEYKFPYQHFRTALNMLAPLRGRMRLPELHKNIPYAHVHSPLCHPQYTDVFRSILFHAQQQARLRRKDSISFAMAERDPRRKSLKGAIYYKMKAKHTLHSFSGCPEAGFDHRKISYFELSRL